jgi:hypothetical protein
MFQIINEMFSILSKIRGDQVSALASNTMCLSCGRGDVNFMPPVEVVKGNNGHYYRTDNLKKSPNSNRGTDYEFGRRLSLGIDVYTKEEQTAEHTYHSHLPVDSIIQNNSDFPEGGGETHRKKRVGAGGGLFRRTGGISKPIKLRNSGDRTLS